jgi:hypothetical protein
MHETALEDAALLAKQGDIEGASRLLTDAVDHGHLSVESRARMLAALIRYRVTASRHHEAVERAVELAAHLCIPRVARLAACVLALVLRFLPPIAPRGRTARLFALLLRTRSMRAGATWDAVRAVQLGMYWHQIKDCRQLSLIQVALSRNETEMLQSLAWLGYSYAYGGHAWIGIPLLRRTLTLAHRSKATNVLVETYPLLAIGYGMSRQSARGRHYHELFQRRYASQDAFYKLLSLTNTMVLSLAEGDLETLKANIDQCFTYSFALAESRHHLQIYGSHAVLLAAEGRTEEAARALAVAQAAAAKGDNHLDWTIFLRIAAIAYTIEGRWDHARSAAERGLAHCAAYGHPRWYRRELRALLATARRPWRISPYRARLMAAVGRYLRAELLGARASTAEGKLSHLSDQLA